MSSRFGARARQAGVGKVSDVGKDLKIKVGIVRRLTKEVKSYQKELVEQQDKIEKMKADGKDIYDIRKQEECLAETQMMIPDSNNRCEESLQNLKRFLDEKENEIVEKMDEIGNEKMKESYLEAKELLGFPVSVSVSTEEQEKVVASSTSTSTSISMED